MQAELWLWCNYYSPSVVIWLWRLPKILCSYWYRGNLRHPFFFLFSNTNDSTKWGDNKNNANWKRYPHSLSHAHRHWYRIPARQRPRLLNPQNDRRQTMLYDWIMFVPIKVCVYFVNRLPSSTKPSSRMNSICSHAFCAFVILVTFHRSFLFCSIVCVCMFLYRPLLINRRSKRFACGFVCCFMCGHTHTAKTLLQRAHGRYDILVYDFFNCVCVWPLSPRHAKWTIIIIIVG